MDGDTTSHLAFSRPLRNPAKPPRGGKGRNRPRSLPDGTHLITIPIVELESLVDGEEKEKNSALYQKESFTVVCQILILNLNPVSDKLMFQNWRNLILPHYNHENYALHFSFSTKNGSKYVVLSIIIIIYSNKIENETLLLVKGVFNLHSSFSNII